MVKINKAIRIFIGIIIIMLISTASFFLYFTLRQGIVDLFNKIGITNFYVQSLTALVLIVSLVFALSIMLGKKANLVKLLRDIIKT